MPTDSPHTSTEWTNDEWPVCDITELTRDVHRWMIRSAPTRLRPSHPAVYAVHVERERQTRHEVNWAGFGGFSD